jgi:hypothetical protein
MTTATAPDASPTAIAPPPAANGAPAAAIAVAELLP